LQAKEGRSRRGDETEEKRTHNELVFIRRAFGEPVAATRNIPPRVCGQNAPDAIDFLQPSIGIHGARHRN